MRSFNFLIIIFAFMLAFTRVQAAGEFSRSCVNTKIVNGATLILVSTCRWNANSDTNPGGYRTTQLYLNYCLGNFDGALKASIGPFPFAFDVLFFASSFLEYLGIHPSLHLRRIGESLQFYKEYLSSSCSSSSFILLHHSKYQHALYPLVDTPHHGTLMHLCKPLHMVALAFTLIFVNLVCFVQGNNFLASCKDTRIVTGSTLFLISTCHFDADGLWDHQPGWRTVQLYLNWCLGNFDGVLKVKKSFPVFLFWFCLSLLLIFGSWRPFQLGTIC